MTEDITQLAQRLGNTLSTKGWQISCAESCTGGGIGYAITSISGSSAWFKKGFITYSNDAKQELLGVSEDTLIQYGAVSAQTVEEMAEGAAKNANAEVAIAISGVAGPDGGTPDKPVGTVWFGFYINGQSISQKLLITGNRQDVRIKAIEFALFNTLMLLQK
ncbi:CinA family protein [Paraglaciecola psychrophila]|uniref:CinA-like protein n=1 Tax=Paraglaciecola psychrophila 170 TaxID=1129794 RepID=K6YT77_9ALTE|nr:nicotinamide-nucleotide amidohydrolase family protein [Paraglaciecola psychrophila]AGH43712.1 CinA-like protein [Paraglaciecola psychrophila 170]GAC35924.1 protein ygaD [Paraglaciecola psychrophila 170]